MKILVTGGSGFVGGHLCRELKSRGHSVTALSRRPSEGDLPGGVEKAMGDVTAYDSLVEPMRGQDVVVNLVALSPLFKPSGGDEMHDRIHRQGTENVVQAAEETGVEKIVQMSALGADPDGNTAYIRAKGEAEEIVQSSSLRHVIFRPSVIFGEGGEFVSFTKKLAPPYLTPLPGGGKTRFQPIWIGDLAPILATATEDDAYDGGVYELGGPEKLTLAEVARIVHGSEGRPMTVLPVPMPLAKVGLSVLGSLPGAPMGADQYRSLQFDNTTTHNDVDAFGVEESSLQTLGAYLGER
ncbi:NADH dehydrogenase [Haloplanus vescus]|uniref:NADH dehydrogenase n=1 Tax=Haloplanus vescus TaxID=555874 RepID=A0A1H3Y4Y4_9EURY|nr:complex I NDUFA9 subunit family protein [Haloplanus vescus]SEA06725.1 NADH dehydrogenase [Haloplanus vescus]